MTFVSQCTYHLNRPEKKRWIKECHLRREVTAAERRRVGPSYSSVPRWRHPRVAQDSTAARSRDRDRLPTGTVPRPGPAYFALWFTGSIFALAWGHVDYRLVSFSRCLGDGRPFAGTLTRRAARKTRPRGAPSYERWEVRLWVRAGAGSGANIRASDVRWRRPRTTADHVWISLNRLTDETQAKQGKPQSTIYLKLT